MKGASPCNTCSRQICLLIKKRYRLCSCSLCTARHNVRWQQRPLLREVLIGEVEDKEYLPANRALGGFYLFNKSIFHGGFEDACEDLVSLPWVPNTQFCDVTRGSGVTASDFVAHKKIISLRLWTRYSNYRITQNVVYCCTAVVFCLFYFFIEGLQF